jgi:hypothetical protein
MPLTNIGNQLKLKICHHVEVCIRIYNCFYEMSEYGSENNNEASHFTRNSFCVLFCSKLSKIWLSTSVLY